MTLVCVVLNVTSPGHWIDTTNLFNYCFDNFAVYNVADQVSPFGGDVDGSPRPVSPETGNWRRRILTERWFFPKPRALADAQAEVVPKSSDEDPALVGQVTYTYAGHYVGQTTVSYQQSEKGAFPFHNLDPAEGGSQVRGIHINFFMILLILAAFGGNCPRDFRAGTDLFPDQYPPAQTEEQRKEEKACLPADSQEPPERPQILEERTSRGYAGSGIGDIRQIEGISLSYAGT